MASAMTHLRLAILIGIFNIGLLARIALPLILFAAIGLTVGWLWTRHSEGHEETRKQFVPRNPLEVWVALLFGGAFIVMLALTGLAIVHIGWSGVFGVAIVTGFTNVDPFVPGLTQSVVGSRPRRWQPLRFWFP